MNSANRCIFLLLTLAVTGCASLGGEATIDWFVRVANEPKRENTRFCVSSAPETEDGSNPTERGVAHMACGDNLVVLKKQTVSNCENAEKLKCMPVYYFERGKDKTVKDFKSENMARKAEEERRIQLQAQKAEEERLSVICSKYGFKINTPAHANCVMRQSQHEQAMRVQQERLDVENRIKEQQESVSDIFRRLGAAGKAMNETMQRVDPQPTVCQLRQTSFGNWQMVCP